MACSKTDPTEVIDHTRLSLLLRTNCKLLSSLSHIGFVTVFPLNRANNTFARVWRITIYELDKVSFQVVVGFGATGLQCHGLQNGLYIKHKDATF